MISSLYKKHSITFFYLMLLLVFSHSFISAQTPDMPFNIYLKQASLKEFTAKIEQLSEYSFIYGEEVVLKHPITLDLKETPLTTILQTAFIKQDISFMQRQEIMQNLYRPSARTVIYRNRRFMKGRTGLLKSEKNFKNNACIHNILMIQ